MASTVSITSKHNIPLLSWHGLHKDCHKNPTNSSLLLAYNQLHWEPEDFFNFCSVITSNRWSKNKCPDALPKQNLCHVKHTFGKTLVLKILRNLQPKVNTIWRSFIPLHELGPRVHLSQINLELAQPLATSKRTKQAQQKHYHKLHQNWRQRKQVTTESCPFSNSLAKTRKGSVL